jgi:hypothetical protein
MRASSHATNRRNGSTREANSATKKAFRRSTEANSATKKAFRRSTEANSVNGSPEGYKTVFSALLVFLPVPFFPAGPPGI